LHWLPQRNFDLEMYGRSAEAVVSITVRAMPDHAAPGEPRSSRKTQRSLSPRLSIMLNSSRTTLMPSPRFRVRCRLDVRHVLVAGRPTVHSESEYDPLPWSASIWILPSRKQLVLPYFSADMKRDVELVRTILLEIEAQPSGPPIFGVNAEGKSDSGGLEHIALLIEAGLPQDEGTSSPRSNVCANSG
jgi:hypothetical protein